MVVVLELTCEGCSLNKMVVVAVWVSEFRSRWHRLAVSVVVTTQTTMTAALMTSWTVVWTTSDLWTN